ncbi:hypothetical protein [Pseudaminobacter soli (ex Li et al. 2025)]|uniref:Uncharacterized protein n=1 Tax=Pseudaminobacter soli (ex Li et al. 2025) TaxID=1295366 RepID=A0A2P7RUA3_9HYPH|nr:hypothetical protein [Mesorhizobium soli]PSJ53779.1 hypothetical protein C7I85_27815 [Mesorhizobium soli]
MEEQLQQFDRMVDDLDKAVPAPVLPAFRALIGEFRVRLISEIRKKSEIIRSCAAVDAVTNRMANATSLMSTMRAPFLGIMLERGSSKSKP